MLLLLICYSDEAVPAQAGGSCQYLGQNAEVFHFFGSSPDSRIVILNTVFLKLYEQAVSSDICFNISLKCLCLLFTSHQSNGWDPNDMFKYNEEKYGVLSTYDSSLSTYT